jgi:hypothetical protein
MFYNGFWPRHAPLRCAHAYFWFINAQNEAVRDALLRKLRRMFTFVSPLDVYLYGSVGRLPM